MTALLAVCLITSGMVFIPPDGQLPRLNQPVSQNDAPRSAVLWFSRNKVELSKTARHQLDVLIRSIPQEDRSVVLIHVTVIHRDKSEARFSFSLERARSDEIKRYLFYHKQINLSRIKECLTTKIDPHPPRAERDTIRVEIRPAVSISDETSNPCGSTR